jgi:DNA-binding MarR family transcriptional regulator
VSDSGRWPGGETAAPQVKALPPAERQVLAALAIVGRASLSAAELADVTVLDDVRPVIDDLERRGLIKRDERQRYSALSRIGEQIRNTDEALAAGDRLLQYITTLAKDGALTPERLAEDAEAILGLSEWAAETRQWAALLELVKTLQACFGIAHRVEKWLTLLERGRSAARTLGDPRSEVWVLQQMATASASAGNASAAQDYLRSADELQRVASRLCGASLGRMRPWLTAVGPSLAAEACQGGRCGSSVC